MDEPNMHMDADMDGRTRLVDGSSGVNFEYGRLEIFARGFWRNICQTDGFTPDSAKVACRALGYDGGAALQITLPSQVDPSQPGDVFTVTITAHI